MKHIVSRTIVFPAQLDRLAELEAIVAEILAQAPDLANAEIVQNNVVLALHELCVNIMKHAYAGQNGELTVNFSLTCDPTRLEINTFDNSNRIFNMAEWREPDLNDPPIHGLGMYLIKQLMDVVEYQRTPEGNRWRLVKVLPLSKSFM